MMYKDRPEVPAHMGKVGRNSMAGFSIYI